MFKGTADQEWERSSMALHQGRICLSALFESLRQRRALPASQVWPHLL